LLVCELLGQWLASELLHVACPAAGILPEAGWQHQKEREWSAWGCEKTDKALIEKQVRARQTRYPEHGVMVVAVLLVCSIPALYASHVIWEILECHCLQSMTTNAWV
jgi:hypothetical protein